MRIDFSTADKRKNIRIIIGTIAGTVSGLLFGTALVGIAQATSEPWVGSYIDIIIYSMVGIVTGIIFGIYAKPSHKAVQGGILGGIVAIGFKSVTLLFGVVTGNAIVKVFGLFYATIVGFTIGGMVGALVWLVGQTQEKIRLSQQQSARKDKIINTTSESVVEGRSQIRKVAPLLERKYRVKWGQVFLGFVPLIYFIPATLLLIGISIWFVSDLLQDTDTQLLGFVVVVCLGSGSLFATIFCLYLIMMPLFYALGTFLKISPEGLEYLRWPYFGMRCGWNDIERLGKSRWATRREYDVLYLKKSEPFGWQLSTKIRQIFRMNTNWGILLSDLQGWPTGQLADDLRHYVPYIFSEDRTEN